MSTATPPLLARFANLVSYQSQHAENGIPREVMEYLAANKVFPVVSPAGLVGRNANAHLRGWPGLCITIAQCVPGHGPVAHNHTGTLETFFCLDGRFDVLWGNALEHKVTLQPGDLCSMPPGVYRTFRNLSDADARLLVLIQGDREMSDKIEMPRTLGDEIRRKYGDPVMERLAAINMRFQGDDAADIDPAQMQQRLARAAAVAPHTSGEGEVLRTMMTARAAGAAAVQCWPGIEVALLALKHGEPSAAHVPDGHRQWVVNIGDAQLEVDIDGQRVMLGRFDMLCAEGGSARTVTALAGEGVQEAKALLVTQSRETIQH